MSRPPRRPKKTNKLVKLTVMITADELRAIDVAAEILTKNEPMGRKITRTDVVRWWLRRGREAAAAGGL